MYKADATYVQCSSWPLLHLSWIILLWYIPKKQEMDMYKICLSWGPICPSANGDIGVCCMFRRALLFFWSAEAWHRASKDARILHWTILWWIHVASSFNSQFTDRLGLKILKIHLSLCRGEEEEEKLVLKACSWISPKLFGSRFWLWTVITTSYRTISFFLLSKTILI